MKTIFISAISVLALATHCFGDTQITYKYDELGRLVQATDPVNGDRGYQYDKAGNRSAVTVSVNNSPPVAVYDSVVAELFVAHQFNLTANDSDPNGDPITIVSVTKPGNASVTIKSASTVEIVGTAARTNQTFTYTISDGKGGTAVGTVMVTVN